MAADLTDRVTVNEAFHILLPVMEPHEARVLLNTAIAANRVRFLADGEKVLADWFETCVQIGAKSDPAGQWTAQLKMLRGVKDFYRTEWTISRADVLALRAEKIRSSKHAGGKPPVHSHDEIRAAAFVALIPFLKKGTLPKDYSGNDLARDCKELLGDLSPKDTLLKEVLNPLLNHIKLQLNSGR